VLNVAALVEAAVGELVATGVVVLVVYDAVETSDASPAACAVVGVAAGVTGRYAVTCVVGCEE
jgi:hypothetical protein